MISLRTATGCNASVSFRTMTSFGKCAVDDSSKKKWPGHLHQPVGLYG
jgi:hypothetical protein